LITSASMGNLPCGTEVRAFTLQNASGASMKVSSLGGCLLSIVVPDQKGRLSDVTLGYPALETLAQAGGYMGFLIGRFGNRIGGAQFELNGKTYALAKNDGENHLHGGLKGFDKRVWGAEIKGDTLALTLRSPDGEEGYPGTLDVTVTYSFSDENTLGIRYEAVCDQDTVLNLTNHVYFNLSGPDCQTLDSHEILINADAFTEVSSPACIPTGRLAPVEGTPLDLRAFRNIGEGLALEERDTQMRYGGGYDHNFVLRGWDQTLRQAAIVRDKATGRRLETWTDQPGVQFYSGNFIKDDRPGKCGPPYRRRQGFCLETQHYPDSVHHQNFPTCVLRKGEKYETVTEYRFSAEAF